MHAGNATSECVRWRWPSLHQPPPLITAMVIAAAAVASAYLSFQSSFIRQKQVCWFSFLFAVFAHPFVYKCSFALARSLPLCRAYYTLFMLLLLFAMPCIVLISLYHKHTIRAISLSYVVRHRTLFSSLIHGIFKQTHLYTTGNDNNQAANQASNQSIRPADFRIQAFKAEWRKPNQTNQDETETSTSSNFWRLETS